jgi:serine/threonine protein kinase
MNIFEDLAVVALRHVASAVSYGVTEAAYNHLVERFTNHGDQLKKALQKANERAWQTLESALVGPSFFDFLKRADDKALSEQIRKFLDHSQLKGITSDTRFCKNCLEDLRAARKDGLLTGQAASFKELGEQTGEFALLKAPDAVLEAEWTRVQHVASLLRNANYIHLAKLLGLRPANKSSPILASSVRYFFHREIESDPKLFQSLAFAKLEAISERQKELLVTFTAILEQHGQRFAEVTEEVLTKLGVIEFKIDQLLDLQKKAVVLLEKVQMHDREIRAADSFSIRNDGERQLVRQLIQEYRKCPEEQRRRFPELLNNVGKLEVATGNFEAAQRDFSDVATLAAEPKTKAEAQFNAYQAALEQKKWGEALVALKEAVALDPLRYEPFSFTKYEPERILGAGGFGAAFLCKHRFLPVRMVVKSLRTTDMDRTITDVFSEAQALQQLKHPGIIQLTDCDFADRAGTRPFLVMDYFDGDNLDSYIGAQGLMSHADLLGIATPMAEALQAAHAKGILHRDVKPANVLVRREPESWQVKLIDFGLAIQPGSFEGKASTQGPRSQTIAGRSIAGTMYYAAPEQMGNLPGVEVGTHSDIYGFGKTCYYALFKTPEPDDVEKEGLPDEWRKLLRRCTAQKLAHRMTDFASVLAELREIAAKKPAPEPDPDPVVVPDPLVASPVKDPPGDIKLFYLTAKGITATGHESPDGFVVLANSQAVLDTVPSVGASFKACREDLVNRRVLTPGDDYFVLAENYTFSSASAAASVLLGRNANGREEWVDADGRTLKDIQTAGIEPVSAAKQLELRLKRIERKIKRIERFDVVIVHHSDDRLPTYNFERASNGDLTVAQWRDQRFARLYPECEVKVLFDGGEEAHGVTKLSTVRESYTG